MKATTSFCAVVILSSMAFPAAVSAQSLEPQAGVSLRYNGLALASDRWSDMLISRGEIEAYAGLAVPDDEGVGGELRLATGDPTRAASRWAALGELGRPSRLGLDRAYLSVGPEALPELRATVGKWPVPWHHTGLVFDSDVTFPGLWIGFRRPLSGVVSELRASPGLATLFYGRPDGRDDILIAGGEVGASFLLGHGGHLHADLGTFNLVGGLALGQAIARGDLSVGERSPGFTSNTTPTDDADAHAELTRRLVLDGLASHFNVVSLHLRADLGVPEAFPLSVVVHGALNAGAAGPGASENKALVVGLIGGDLSELGGGQVSVRLMAIEADAVLDAYADDAQGTNLAGVKVAGAYRFSDPLTVRFDGLLSTALDGGLRTMGDARGEPDTGRSVAMRVRVILASEF